MVSKGFFRLDVSIFAHKSHRGNGCRVSYRRDRIETLLNTACSIVFGLFAALYFVSTYSAKPEVVVNKKKKGLVHRKGVSIRKCSNERHVTRYFQFSKNK